jgi:hypothetical protein
VSGWLLQPSGFTPPAQLLNQAKAGTFLDPAELSAAPSLVSGTIYATAMMVFTPGVASNLVMRIATALVTPTAGLVNVGPTGGLISPRRSGTVGTGQTALPASFVPGATAANFAPGVFAF